MTLIENRIYRLPNGREVVAIKTAEQFVLRNLRDWESDQIPEYKVNPGGRLVIQGRLTAWSVEDLIETGLIEPTPGRDTTIILDEATF